MVEVTHELADSLGPFTFKIWRYENYSGEHREWSEEYTLPKGANLTREIVAAAFTTAQAQAAAQEQRIAALEADAERWRAFYSSERFYVMGAAGFDWEKSAVREPRDETNWLHFTLTFGTGTPRTVTIKTSREGPCCSPMSIIFAPAQPSENSNE